MTLGVCLANMRPLCAMGATVGESPPHPRKDHIVSEDQAGMEVRVLGILGKHAVPSCQLYR